MLRATLGGWPDHLLLGPGRRQDRLPHQQLTSPHPDLRRGGAVEAHGFSRGFHSNLIAYGDHFQRNTGAYALAVEIFEEGAVSLEDAGHRHAFVAMGLFERLEAAAPALPR